MIDSPPQQILSVGDLIGCAFRIYRRHYMTFLPVLIMPTVASIAGKVGLQWALSSMSTVKSGDLAPILGIVGVSLVCGLISLVAYWILTLRQLAFVRVINGVTDDFWQAYKDVKNRAWSLLAVYLLGQFVIAFIILIWTIEIIISALVLKTTSTAMLILGLTGVFSGIFGMIFSLCFVGFAGMIIFSALVCEELGMTQLISRSLFFTFRSLGRSVVFGILIFVTVTALSYPLYLPLVGLYAFEMFRHGLSGEALADPSKLPFYVLAASQAWESIINILLWPIVFVAFGLFYNDLRMRMEGVDVTRSLRRLEAAAGG